MPVDLIVGCNLAAGFLVLVAFATYNLKGQQINTGTWIILAFGDSLDLASYFEMTEEWWKSIVPAAFAVGSILTFFFGLIRKRFSWPDGFDWFIVTIDLAIIGLWSWYDSSAVSLSIGSHEFAPPAVANLAFQATAVIAFIPMYRALITRREHERPGSWALWSLAFVLFSASSIASFDTFEEIVYPIVGLITHGLVLVLALALPRPKPLRTT